MDELKKRKYRKAALKLRHSLALEHINALMERAILLATQSKIELAEKVALLARKMARWMGIKLGKWRYFFCRHCKSFIFPGITARVRVRNNRFTHVVIYCKKCKNFNRIRIVKEATS